jgi:hypothetical protein
VSEARRSPKVLVAIDQLIADGVTKTLELLARGLLIEVQLGAGAESSLRWGNRVPRGSSRSALTPCSTTDRSY